MYNGAEKPKNKIKLSGIYLSYRQFYIILGLAVLVVILAAGFVLFSYPQLNASSPAQADGINIDSAQGWQATGLRLEAGQVFIVEYLEGDWSIWDQDPHRYTADGGSAPCNAADCVEPIPNYTKSGLIGRIGDGEAFPVGSYLETTATNSGMLQLRVNDAATFDNEGIITVLVTLGN